MNQEAKKALSDRLGEMTVKERKQLMRRAAEIRAAAQRNSKKPAGTIEDWMARLLSIDLSSDSYLVVSVEATRCLIEVGGEIKDAMIARDRPVVGDRVEVVQNRVRKVLPRRTVLARPSDMRHGREQIVAANLDYVVIVVSVGSPPLHPRLIDRMLLAVQAGGAEPLIVVNKVDDREGFGEELAKLDPYRELGIRVFECSAIHRTGTSELRQAISGKRCAFVGHSGVGKSSLVNALVGGQNQETGAVSEKSGKGRHTTTRSSLVRLEDGTELVDTPGVRSFAVSQQAEIAEGFPEFAPFVPLCRFSDCSHDQEPGCAVKQAVRDGHVARERYDAYRRLQFGETETGGGFICEHCGATAVGEGAGTRHRNHCPRCLHSVHLDHRPGDRAAACGGKMQPVAVWVRTDGEWALVHRCMECGAMASNRIAADDNEMLLLSIAAKPLASPPFPLEGTASAQ